VLAYALEAMLRAMHPFVPFITEELWQRLPKPEPSPVSIALGKLPDSETGRADGEAVREMSTIQEVIGAVRSIRSEREVHPATQIAVVLRTGDAAVRALLAEERLAQETLMKTSTLVIEASGVRPTGAALAHAAGVEVLVLLKGVVDQAGEKARIERELKKAQKNIEALEKKLSGKGFAERAPAEVVKETEDQLAAYRARLSILEEARKLADEL
jgi:valyl-tRNA synthetase